MPFGAITMPSGITTPMRTFTSVVVSLIDTYAHYNTLLAL